MDIESNVAYLANQCAELSEIVGQNYDQIQNVVEYVKEESLKQLTLKSLLIDKGIIDDGEYEELYHLFKKQLDANMMK